MDAEQNAYHLKMIMHKKAYMNHQRSPSFKNFYKRFFKFNLILQQVLYQFKKSLFIACRKNAAKCVL
jgi:hypothetical protein